MANGGPPVQTGAPECASYPDLSLAEFEVLDPRPGHPGELDSWNRSRV